MNLTLIIPLLNEQESLPELHQWIVKVMHANDFSYEVLFIDDGSTDDSTPDFVATAALIRASVSA